MTRLAPIPTAPAVLVAVRSLDVAQYFKCDLEGGRVYVYKARLHHMYASRLMSHSSW